MKIRTTLNLIVLILSIGTFHEPAHAQAPGNTAITYQGRLAFNGMAVNEDCEVVFSLYDAAAGGQLLAQVGSDAAPRVVNVHKGLFTQPLDFGMTAFSGGERWLEIAVRPAGSDQPFSVLSPRQCITPTPYALHALSGGDVSSLDQAYNKGGPGAGRTIHTTSGPMSIEGDGGLVVAGNVGIGTLSPNSKLEVAGVVHSTIGGFMFPDGTIQTTAALGSGDPRVLGDCLDGPGGFPDNVLCIDNSGNVGIGLPAAVVDFTSRLHIAGASEANITLELDPEGNTAPTKFGINFITGDGGGTNLGDIYVDQAMAGTPLFLNGQNPNDVIIAFGGGVPGNVGIGTVSPMNRLSVDGDADFTGNVGIGTFSPANPLTVDGNANFTGNVGIGTATPASPLEVNGIIHSTAGGIMFPDNSVQTTAATAGGDITAVLTPAGSGLTGGAMSGDVTLQVDFTPSGGVNGTATTVARGDHTHNDIGGGAITVDGLGNVGIGTPPNPMFKLDVAGNIHTLGTISAGAFASNSPFIAEAPAGTPRLRIDDVSGFVSIGSPPSAAPAQRLDVDGSVRASSQFISLDAVNPPFVVSSSALVVGLNTDLLDGVDSTGFALLAGRPGGQTLNGGTLAGDPLSLNGSTTNDGDILMNVAGGNVGIGNPAPAEKLDVTGNAHVTGNMDVDGTVITDFVNAQSPLQLQTDGTTRVYIAGLPDPNPGFVGIGTTTPLSLLDVNGDVNVTGNQSVGGDLDVTGTVFTDFVSSHSPLQLQISGTTMVFIADPSGFVGIDTNTPQNPLQVSKAGGATAALSDGVHLGRDTANDAHLELVRLGGTPYIDFLNDNTEDFDARIRLEADDALSITGANVGIGTTTPNEQLHVVNNAQVDGTIYTSDVSSRDGVSPLDLELNDAPVVHVDPNGNVGIGPPAMGGPPIPPDEALHVNGCIKADCFKLSGERPLFVSALSAVTSSANLTLIPAPAGTVRIRPNTTGIQNVMVPVQIAQGLIGTLQQLVRVRISYRVTSSTTFITSTRARTTDDAAGTFVTLLDDGTDQKSNAWTFYEITLPAPLDINGPLFLNLELSVAGTGSANDIELGRMVVTVADAP